MGSMKSLFKTPPSVRMSPGKKRALWASKPSLSAIHSALTRASAARAEERNLHARMMEAGQQKRAMTKRHRNLVSKVYNLRYRMKWTPSPSIQRQINQVQKEINANLPNLENKERKVEKLVAEWEKAQKRYHQLARRVTHLNGTRVLNSSPLTANEKAIVRITGAIVKNMSAARRTTRRLPLGQNISQTIIRSAARR
jgi:predicted RNase H-like nuclease (RuvC/YqgF family)